MSRVVEDYLQEGLVLKLDDMLEKTPNVTVTELKANASLFVSNMKLNTKAIARVTSSRAKFIPTKMIALSVIIEDFSEIRRLIDFKGFKDLKLLRYDRKKFEAGLTCLGITDFRCATNPSSDEFKVLMNNLMKECRKNDKAGERTFVLF